MLTFLTAGPRCSTGVWEGAQVCSKGGGALGDDALDATLLLILFIAYAQICPATPHLSLTEQVGLLQRTSC
eukprot:155231-Chlamydomonas_euryale.AAC.3